MKGLASVLLAAIVLAGCSEEDAPATANASTGEPGTMTGNAATSEATDGSGSTTGTTGTELEGKEKLVDVELWAPEVNDAVVPFGPRPAGTVCEIGFGVEGGLYEIDSGLCTWGTFVQPSLAPIAAGDTLEFVLVHDNLFAEQQGVSANLGTAVGDAILWELEIPIPAEAAFMRPAFEAPADAPAGTPLRFHVHNHGVNNYRLVDFTVTHN